MNAIWLKYFPVAVRERLSGKLGLQAILGNSGWLFADRLVRMGFGVVVSVWLARSLGPERFGQLSYAIAFSGLFGAVAGLGLDGIVVRELVRNPDDKNRIIGSTFVLKLIGSCAAFSMAWGAINYFRPLDAETVLLVTILAAGMLFQVCDAVDLWFQANVISKYSVLTRNFAFLFSSAVKIYLIYIKAAVLTLALAFLFETMLAALGFFIVFQVTGNSWFKLRVNCRYMFKLLAESWPLMLSGIAVTLYMRIDQVMLSGLIDEQSVGIYSAVIRLSEAWYVIPTVIVASSMPYLTQSREQSRELFAERLRALATVLVKVAYVVAAIISVFAEQLIFLIYGESYVEAAFVLVVHIWAAVFVFLGVVASPWILNEGFTKMSFYQTGGGALINIGFNFYLIPIYGAAGAAVATVISQCVSSWFFNCLFVKSRPLFWIQSDALCLGLLSRLQKI